jgi:hypothetical protein
LLLLVELAIVAFVVVVAAATWILVHALEASGRLSEARDDIARVRQDLVSGQDATRDLAAAEADARAAQRDTHDFVWAAGSWLPPLKTLRGLTSAVDTLAQDALPGVVKVGPSLQPKKLRIADNRIAIAPLHAAAPTLARIAVATARARDRVANLPSGWIGPLTTMRDKALSQLTSLAGEADDVSRFARAGPSMLGEHGLRRYFVGVQNNAEARATGGLVAAYAIVTADHGSIHVVERGNDSKFRNALQPVLNLPAGYRALYGNYLPAQKWITSNLSPNFPVAASIWAGLWQAQSGKHIDGAFGIDPYGLGDLLSAVGPIQLKGYEGTFTGRNLPAYIESGEYVAFQSLAAQSLRKQFLSEIAGAVLEKLLSGAGDAHRIAAEFGHAAGRGDLELWSARPDEEAAIAGTPLAGAIPGFRTPFVSLSVDSGTGTKLDYYLDRRLTYDASSCGGSTRVATITVRLTNTAPRFGLPPYVRLRGDLNGGRSLVVEQVPRNVDLVWVHASSGSALLSASLDGRSVLVSSGVESGKSVYGVRMNLDPGVPRTLTLRVQEPVLPGPVLTQIQPMPRPQRTIVHAPVCA